MNARALRVLVLTSILAEPLWAHHGKTFLVTSSFETAHQGQAFGLLSTGTTLGSSDSRELELEPGLLYGISQSLSAEIHAHLHAAPGFEAEAMGLETHLHLLDAGILSTAALGEYEAGLSGHPGSFEGRLIVGSELGRSTLAGNLILAREQGNGNKAELDYSLGVTRSLIGILGLGMEMKGPVKGGRTPEWAPSLSLGIHPRLGMLLGALYGESHSQDEEAAISPWALRLTAIYGF